MDQTSMCQGANTCNKDKALPCALVAFDALLICLSTSYFTSTLITTILFSCTEGKNVFRRAHASGYFYPLTDTFVHFCVRIDALS